MSPTDAPRLDARQRDALASLGIDYWVPRAASGRPGAPDSVAAVARPEDAGDRDAGPRAPEGSAAAWTALQSAVAGCTRCGLHGSRTQTVFGVGRRDADWMIIGEAPGAEEDRRGEPFVGRAGQLLDAMLAALDLDRQQVFIANILKCRPPQNRDPRPEEIDACRAHLRGQIDLVRPRLILAVGRIAAQSLLGTDAPVGRLRGRVHRLEPDGIPLVVTYHPAYLLRSPGQKRRAWEDLCLAREAIRRVPS